MPGREQPLTNTRLSAEKAAEAFVIAVRRYLPELASPELAGILLAHSALETGHWKQLRNYNFGNVKATFEWVQDGGDYVFYEAGEWLTGDQVAAAQRQSRPRTDGGEGADMRERQQDDAGRGLTYCSFYPSHPQCRFRSFASAPDGLADHMHKLGERYGAALEAAAKGEVSEFVRQLWQKGYFTAVYAPYHDAVVSLYDRYAELASDTYRRLARDVHRDTKPDNFGPDLLPLRVGSHNDPAAAALVAVWQFVVVYGCGLDLGSGGPAGDGVDGIYGETTDKVTAIVRTECGLPPGDVDAELLARIADNPDIFGLLLHVAGFGHERVKFFLDPPRPPEPL